MKIIKCGGSVLKDYSNRLLLYDEIKGLNDKVILIVSAFNDSPYSTKSLKLLLENNYTYEMEQELITLGEVISSIRVTNELLNNYIDASLIFKEQIGINVFTTNKMENIVSLDNSFIQEKVKKHKVIVIPGFIGINQNNRIVSLNKNGSDLTAILVAKMLNQNEVFLYKDVLGLSSIDPTYKNNYKLYKNISYSLMQQLILHGNTLLQEEALKIAKDNDITIHIQHYLNHSSNTIISKSNKERIIVLQLKDNNIYLEGYNNKDNIENILMSYNLKYDYILPCNTFLKIVTSYKNEDKIINLLHDKFIIRGEI